MDEADLGEKPRQAVAKARTWVATLDGLCGVVLVPGE